MKTEELVYIVVGCIGAVLVLVTQKYEHNKVAKALNYLGAMLASGAGICLIAS